MSGTRSSDDEILSRIPGLDDGDDNDQSTSTTEQEGSGPEQQRSTGQPADGADSDRSGATDPTATTDSGPPVVRRRDGLVERQSQDGSRQRDLVDPITGQIVARGGIERRIYDKAQRTERELAQTKQQLEQYQQQLRGHTEAGGIGQQLGLNAEQQTVAMRVMADFIRDPVRTVEYMIQEVRSKGHRIPALEQAGVGQLDLGAVQRLLDERLKPITSRYEQEQQQVQREQAARRELDSFIQQVPDVRANLDVLSNMLREDNQLSLHTAYLRLVEYAADNGLDHRQPLGPQIQARQTSQQPGSLPRQQRPLPNGRTAMNGAAPLEARRGFDENTEWSDIIQSSMREAGFNR